MFEDCAPVVTSLLDGFNVCILAYGQVHALLPVNSCKQTSCIYHARVQRHILKAVVSCVWATHTAQAPSTRGLLILCLNEVQTLEKRWFDRHATHSIRTQATMKVQLQSFYLTLIKSHSSIAS